MKERVDGLWKEVHGVTMNACYADMDSVCL